MAAAFLLSCLSCEDEPPSSATEGTEVSEYRVAVVMPAENQERWNRVAEWVLDDLAEAQRGLPRQVRLKIEWKDENAPDLKEYLEAAASDPEVVAVVGPYHSEEAQLASVCCGSRRKTLILPVSSSVELQRSCAGKDLPDATQTQLRSTGTGWRWRWGSSGRWGLWTTSS